MKKIKTILLPLLAVTFLFSCGSISASYVEREVFSLIIDYTIEKKTDELINLFAKNIYLEIDDFDSQVNELMDYVSGSFVSKSYSLGTLTSTEHQDFKIKSFVSIICCELYTTDYKYFLSYFYCNIDDYDSDNIGMWYLQVQKCTNEDESFLYNFDYDNRMYDETYRGITLI